MSTMQEKALEAQARRAAKAVGLLALKSRCRLHHWNDVGGFQLVDPYCNTVIEGLRYELSPEAVIEFCQDRRA
ncbi:hypothetical protein WN982_00300 [Paraburkholderia sp. IMGN_8]|uniref:hypothetical protein n=1 Tax=Paraburkholderia sp. IMGN_8 TaxID=3136564 RepID=UPI0031018703